MTDPTPSRRELLATLGAAGAAALGSAGEARAADPPGKVYRIGVISASIGGKPHKANGHTWHFAQYFHPEIDYAALEKYTGKSMADYFRNYLRSPRMTFDQLPFPDTRITHVYDADPESAAQYAETFPGVKVARSLDELVNAVDAVWMGDASGRGEDHFDLVAPGLRKGLPTFCDKPIGGTVAGTRQILELARRHKAPLMSSSLFRHEWGMEQALRLRDRGEYGPIEYVIASMASGYSLPGWMIYGQHPAWTVVTLLGPKVDAVSLYAYGDTAHGLVTYKDRKPAEIWYGRPDISGEYCHTAVHFQKQPYTYTASIEGDFLFGHHYEMFRLAHTFRQMVKTGVEPVPHEEILAVTAIVHAGAKSLGEKSRLVSLEEVLG